MTGQELSDKLLTVVRDFLKDNKGDYAAAMGALKCVTMTLEMGFCNGMQVRIKDDPNPDIVKISKEALEALKTQVNTLHRLEAAGVDNWEGYDEAINNPNPEDDKGD